MLNQKSDPWTLNRMLAWAGLLASGGAVWLFNTNLVLVGILAVVGVVCGALGIKSPSRIIGIAALILGIIDIGIILLSIPGLGGATKPAGW